MYGRHVFFKRLVARIAPRGRGDYTGHVLRARDCMRQHHGLYNILLAASKASYDAEAEQLIAARRSAIEEERQRLFTERDSLEQEIRANRETKGIPNHVSSLKFSDEEVQDMCDMLDSVDFKTLRLGTNDDASRIAPPAPSLGEQALIQEFANGLLRAPDVQCPWWCRTVSSNRLLFPRVALCRESGDVDVAYLFLYAKQSPICARFLEMRRRVHVLPTLWDLETGVGELRPRDRSEFDVFPLVHKLERELPFNDDDNLFVLYGLRFDAREVATNHLAEPFEMFTRYHERVAAVIGFLRSSRG